LPELVLVTTNCTGTVCGEFAAPLEVTVIVPLYVPAASPVGFALILRVDGVEPVPGVTASHAPPDAAAVMLSTVPLLVTDRFWLPEVVDPEA